MVGVWRRELKDRFDIMSMMHYFSEVRGWGNGADEWLGEDIGYWRLKGHSLAQRVIAAKCMYSMWQTEDVMSKRRTWLSEQERERQEVCVMCGKSAKAECRSWHLLAECEAAGVVAVRRKALKKVESRVNGAVKSRQVAELLAVPWMLDERGRLRNLGDAEERRKELKIPESSPLAELCNMAQGPRGADRGRWRTRGWLGKHGTRC